MINDILFVLWFFLPVGIANITPIFAAHIPGIKQWSYPIDFNRTFNKKRILGDHKTVRGLVIGIVGAIATAYLQQNFYAMSTFLQKITPVDYANLNPLLFGSLCGIGALGGDALKSFFKRRKNIKAGNAWFPYDQIDYVVGGIIATSFYVSLTFYHYFLALISFFLMHILFTHLGYWLKLKNSPM